MGEEARISILEAQTLEAVESLRIKYLGRKGELTQALRGMGSVPEAERPEVGRIANELRDSIEENLSGAKAALEAAQMEKRLRAEAVDVTLPGIPRTIGTKHVIQQVIEEIEAIFAGLGFEIEDGPEVETDWYNFVALNFPKDHPARDMQATFHITPDILLRTHTSPVQVRGMLKRKPRLPLRLIVPGRVYRRDPADASHSPVFTQVEGLAVDEGVSLGDLKGTLAEFARQFYGPEARTRFRPSYFPFTEPSAEVDVSCTVCHGSGCRLCGGTGWLEILGSGMVHPRVLENGGYDPEKVTGFAFGMGVERIALLKYGIDDIRLFYSGDLRFLKQF
ncbi:MAG: phenylalanine--tRNA ligase subunit alpha [Firmicutes bacterium]|nr:phenylalanine--tRNA ligase subunit alpha [Bacillota bacterium]